MWIRLKNIQVYAYHGVHDYEREHGARFEIDVELEASLDQAIETDDLADTIDYVKVHKVVVACCTENRFHLVETLADTIATALLAQFPVREVTIRVRKPGAAIGGVLDTVEVECFKRKE
jgi:7,8-dihydroneopterin aldolase/epimerase/oxygenase